MIMASLPLFYFCYKALHLSLAHSAILYTIWCLYTCLVFSPLYYLFGRYILLSIYIPLFLVLKDIKDTPSLLFLFIQSILWDTPLILFMRCMSLLGMRALEPFYSAINEHLVIGSMPLESDVNTLHELGVGAVVNMCREYPGPVEAYNHHNILQFRAPTPDLCQPHLHALIEGVTFMQKFHKEHPTKQIFVHCKGGRARAATMGLCYLITTEKVNITHFEDIKKIVDAMVARRPVVTPAILKYPVLKEFVNSVLSKN